MIPIQVLQACGLAVIHTLWAGTLLGLFFWLLRRLADGCSPGIRHGISFAGFFALAASAPAAFLLAARSLQAEPAPLAGPLRIQLPDAGTVHAALPEAAADSRSILAVLLGAAWILGSILCLVRVAVGAGRVRALKRASIPAEEDRWRTRLAELLREMRIRIPVRLLVSRAATSPLVIGVLRPAIVLPASLMTGWTPAQIEMALVHELAHIRRYDNLVRFMQRIVESILFFHPVVWLLARDLDRDREDCCDAAVLNLRGEPALYAASLYSLSNPVRKLAFETSSMADHALLPRIRRILKQESTMMTLPQRCANLGLAFGCVCLLILGVQAQSSERTPVRSGDESAPLLVDLGRLLDESSSAAIPPNPVLRLADLHDIGIEFEGLGPQEEPQTQKRAIERLARALKEANERIERLERELKTRRQAPDQPRPAPDSALESIRAIREAERHVERAARAKEEAERQLRMLHDQGQRTAAAARDQAVLLRRAGDLFPKSKAPEKHLIDGAVLEFLKKGDRLIIEADRDGHRLIRILKDAQRPKADPGEATGEVPILKDLPILRRLIELRAEEASPPSAPKAPAVKYKLHSSAGSADKPLKTIESSEGAIKIETEESRLFDGRSIKVLPSPAGKILRINPKVEQLDAKGIASPQIELVPADDFIRIVSPAESAPKKPEQDPKARRLAEQEQEIQRLRQEIMDLRRLQEELRSQSNRDA